MTSEKVTMAARMILSLTAQELIELNKILEDEGGEAVGVREPRRPAPSTDEAAWPTPAGLPEDYWETAE